jgi:hypothetical protein
MTKFETNSDETNTKIETLGAFESRVITSGEQKADIKATEEYR